MVSTNLQGNRIVDQREVLKIWENYVTKLYDRPNRPETLEDEPVEEVDTDEKGLYILQSEVEKAIKELRNRLQEMMMYWRCAQVIGRRWFENVMND